MILKFDLVYFVLYWFFNSELAWVSLSGRCILTFNISKALLFDSKISFQKSSAKFFFMC